MRLAIDKLMDGDCFQKALKVGPSGKYVDKAEFIKCLPSEILGSEEIDDIIQMLIDMGIRVI